MAKQFFKAMGIFVRMVKIEHSVFALPFAILGLVWSSNGAPGWAATILLILAMVAVRSFAMGFNRLVDLPFDRDNPRTRGRPLVTGELSVAGTKFLLLICAGLFILACAGLNQLCLALAPYALLWSAFYSYTKRFTPFCHFFLGTVLGLAPIAGWLAHDPTLTLPSTMLAFGVLFWVAGFDILYATQDVEFDRSRGLHSMPADLGLKTALALACFSHVTASLFFGFAGWAYGAGWIYFLTWGIVSAVLLSEHLLVDENSLSRVNLVFFTANGFIAIVFMAGALADIYILRA
ncbi:MAG: 4-hydroxybenzoate octaprenyltransferase [Deltaproteobacteria bacterium]|nr:4-hydroxybenzoate octaprenyltransferase [Deltaproteobacteria bacterium]